MNNRSIYIFLIIFLWGSISSYADNLLIDKSVRDGKLSNGLRYFLRHDTSSLHLCDFYLVYNAGSSLKQSLDTQKRGDFLFEPTFFAKVPYPHHNMIDYFNGRGYETPDVSNYDICTKGYAYQLTGVPISSNDIVDSALLVLHDWAKYLNEDKISITNTTDSLMSPVTILQKNKNDYTRMAVIVVGDADMTYVEKKIKRLWHSNPNTPKDTTRGYKITLDKNTPFVLVPESISREKAITLCFLNTRQNDMKRMSQSDYTDLLKKYILAGILGSRLENRIYKSDLPIIKSKCYTGRVGSLGDAFCLSAIPQDNKEFETLEILLEEMEKLHRYGVLPGEIARQQKKLRALYKQRYVECLKMTKDSFSQLYMHCFIDNMPVFDIQKEYLFVDSFMNRIDENTIINSVNEIIKNTPVIIFGCGIVARGDRQIQQKIISLWEDIKNRTIESPIDIQTKEIQITNKIKTGKIKKSSFNQVSGCTEWILRNGIKVIICPTTNKNDEIRMLAFSKGGWEYLETENRSLAKLVPDLIWHMGIGDYSLLDLKKSLNDEQLSIRSSIEGNAEMIEGNSTIEEFEKLLQLVYLQATILRRDSIIFKKRLEQLHFDNQHQVLRTQKNFDDGLSKMIFQNWIGSNITETTSLKNMTVDNALQTYRERFSNIADFTFFFIGNIDPENKTTKELICRWLGGIGTKNQRSEDFKNNTTNVPTYNEKQTILVHKKELNTIYQIRKVVFDLPYSISTIMNMKILARILSHRFAKTIEEKGYDGCYISCYDSVFQYPISTSSLKIQYMADTTHKRTMERMINHELSSIRYNGVSEEELNREKTWLLQTYNRNLNSNHHRLLYLLSYYTMSIDYFTDFEKQLADISINSIQQLMQHIEDKGLKFVLSFEPDNSVK